MSTTATRYPEAAIEADKEVPIIRITRDFRATPAQLMKAHTDPELFVRWNGPETVSSRIVEWDVRDGGSWRYISTHEGQDHVNAQSPERRKIGATEHMGMVLVHRQRRGQDSGFAENALALGLVAGFSPQVAPRGFSILQHRQTPGEDALPEDIPQE